MAKKRVLYSSDDDQMCTKKAKSKLNKIQLTDLKAELLMRTFDELPLDDLSNVAMVNKQFNRLVYNYLGEKCSIGRATIFNTPTAEWLWIANTVGKFKFENPAEFVAFFQTSGHMITDLLIDCHSNYSVTSYKYMERAIFKYCSDALKHIEIRSTYLPTLSECLTHPLSQVAVLEVDACELATTFGEQLNALFPSLQRLVLKNCKAIDPTCVDVHFPRLIEFHFVGLCKNRMVLKKEHLLQAIQRNPQIRRLSIDYQPINQRAHNVNDFELDYDFYRFVCEHLPKLEYLKMWNKRHYDPPAGCDDNYIEFSSLKTFELVDIYHQQPDEIVPFTFEHLQELKLVHLKALTVEWMNFITCNEHLTKLTMQIYGTWSNRNLEGDVMKQREQISKDQLTKIFKRLTHLEELCIDAKTVDGKDLVAVLGKRKSLATIRLREYFLVDGIVNNFERLTVNKPWIVDYDFENLYLQRYQNQMNVDVTYEYFVKKN